MPALEARSTRSVVGRSIELVVGQKKSGSPPLTILSKNVLLHEYLDDGGGGALCRLMKAGQADHSPGSPGVAPESAIGEV